MKRSAARTPGRGLFTGAIDSDFGPWGWSDADQVLLVYPSRSAAREALFELERINEDDLAAAVHDLNADGASLDGEAPNGIEIVNRRSKIIFVDAFEFEQGLSGGRSGRVYQQNLI
ncbi:MAG: hypothetical protein AAFV54_03985, partial [Pseudomonadota bacterium]